MAKQKFKVTTWGEFDKKFSGLARLKYERKDSKLKSEDVLAHSFAHSVIYNNKRDCTYYALCDLGIIDMFGPSEKDPVVLVRETGKPRENWYNDPQNALYFEEAIKLYKEHMDEIREA